MARKRYDSSDERLTEPVRVAELTEYYEGQTHRYFSDPFALRHFIYRTLLTVKDLERARQQLLTDVERAKSQKRRTGIPTTLSPLDAVRFASPEQIETIVGQLNRSQLSALARHVAEARKTHETLVEDLARVRRAADAMASRHDLPAAARTEFVKLLNELPSEPPPTPPVQAPQLIESAAREGLLDPAAAQEALRGLEQAPQTQVAARPQSVPAVVPPPARPTAGALPMPGTPEPQDAVVHTPTNELPQYGPLPAWQPGPGLVRT